MCVNSVCGARLKRDMLSALGLAAGLAPVHLALGAACLPAPEHTLLPEQAHPLSYEAAPSPDEMIDMCESLLRGGASLGAADPQGRNLLHYVRPAEQNAPCSVQPTLSKP